VRIAIASDQAGHEAKQRLAAKLIAAGFEVTDAAPTVNSHQRFDYAEQVALSVLRQDVERGIIVTSRTVGASLAANRVPGIRAAVCNDPRSAYDGANAEGMNVLVLALHPLEHERTQEVVDAYLDARLAPVEVVGGLLPWRLQRVFAHVRENLANELSVAEMAQVVAMSQYCFSKLFKTSTGTTPHQYVMRQRVERAQGAVAAGPNPAGRCRHPGGLRNPESLHQRLSPRSWNHAEALSREALHSAGGSYGTRAESAGRAREIGKRGIETSLAGPRKSPAARSWSGRSERPLKPSPALLPATVCYTARCSSRCARPARRACQIRQSDHRVTPRFGRHCAQLTLDAK
jgi:ribose 5-phosphate isomerase B